MCYGWGGIYIPHASNQFPSIFSIRGEVDDTLWRFFLTGGVALENPHPNPAPEWLTDKSWSEVVRANDLPGLDGFMRGKFKQAW